MFSVILNRVVIKNSSKLKYKNENKLSGRSLNPDMRECQKNHNCEFYHSKIEK